VVDLAEDILGVVEAVDIVLWPVAMDFKKKDVEALADGELAATLLNGAIRTSEQEEMARLLRRKSQVMIAYGACATGGGIPALANQFSLEQLLKFVYEDGPSNANAEHTRPLTESRQNGHTLTLPTLREVVRTLDQVVDVDYYLPGCPPPVDLIAKAAEALVTGTLPEKGAVLAPDVALCSQCPRAETKPDTLLLKGYRRPHEMIADPQLCLLAQGLVCLGSATRAGCGAACIGGNMPCTGCMGPLSGVVDHGGKALSAVASLLDSNDEDEIVARMAELVDPVGTFYRYGLPASLLHRRPSKVTAGTKEEVAP
jgi:F420-non-reducing hydrogenase small subunit